MSNRGQALTLIVLAVALAGCAEQASEVRQQDLQLARQSCASSANQSVELRRLREPARKGAGSRPLPL
jgi:hypothetical protein